MKRPALSRILELFEVDTSAGSLRWKVSGRGIQCGSEAGSAKNKGRHRYAKVDGISYTVANIIWFVDRGVWPKSRLTNKNGDVTDCRIDNLVEQRGLNGFDHSKPEDKARYYRAHRKAYPDHYRNADLKRGFGISLEEYQRMFVEQRGVCGICEKPEKDVRNGKVRWLAVDHNHTTGQVRGLLCGSCNKAIGFMCESVETLTKAIVYLRTHVVADESDDPNVVKFAPRQK